MDGNELNDFLRRSIRYRMLTVTPKRRRSSADLRWHGRTSQFRSAGNFRLVWHMRIIAGSKKGKKLHPVGDMKIRPTSDRTREAIFNILAFQIQKPIVLDLFAGTGALGLEALSRGADSAVFIDNSSDAISLTKKNIARCSFENRTKIIQWDAVHNLDCLKKQDALFNLVLMDPPYAMDLVQPVLRNLHNCGCLRSSARLVVEHPGNASMAEKDLFFSIDDQRKYGRTIVTFLKYTK